MSQPSPQAQSDDVGNTPDPPLRVSTRTKVKPLVLSADAFGAWTNKNLSVIENYVLANIVSDRFTPSNYKEAISSSDKDAWIASMTKEISDLQAMDTAVIVDRPTSANVLPSKWVFKIKEDEAGNIASFKSRWTPMGCNQVEGIDYGETFAPVSKHTSFRILMSVAAVEDLDIHQLDVANAFANADLSEDVYVAAPPGFELPNGKVYKLRKALYGLKQSPLAWNMLINEYIVKLGFHQSSVFITRRMTLESCMWDCMWMT